MNNIRSGAEINPWMQILLLLGYSVGGGIICSLIGLAIVIPLFDVNLFSLTTVDLTGDNLKALKVLQLASSVGMFLFPPLALALTEKTSISKFYGFSPVNVKVLGLVLALMVVSMPFMEWIVSLNQQMTFPEGLKGVERWMRQLEDEAMRQTYAFLKISGSWDLPVNIFLIAVVPAVAEELLFRGALQRAFGRIFANPHFVIWTVAFIFSAVHMQFFGFFPRLLLGAVFGYLYFWTGSLWYPIIAHFLNNAYAVVVAWSLQRNNIPLESFDKTIELSWPGYAVSGALTLLTLYFVKILADKFHGQQLG